MLLKKAKFSRKMKFLILLAIFVKHSLTQSTECVQAFRQACLESHNIFRANHDTPAMHEDPEEDSSAMHWANYLAANFTFGHSRTGENLFASTHLVPSDVDKCAGKFKIK